MKMQQGDVYIESCNDIPKDAKKVQKSKRGFVLAEGEATGHAHVIEDNIEMYEKDGILYIKTDHATEIKHEEHKAIILNSGIYEIGKIKEYDAFEMETRNVRD